MLKNVVVGVADSPEAEVPLRSAIDLVKASGGTLHLVSAYKSGQPASNALPAELRFAAPSTCPADERLAELARVATGEDVVVVTHPVTADPVEAITRVAAQEHADLIVLGHHRTNGRHPLHRSVSGILARRVPCAVMIIPVT